MKISAKKIITRVTDLGYEETPHRHKFCQYLGKVGTTATTIIWLIDMPEIDITNIKESPIYCQFVEECDIHPEKSYVKMLGMDIVHNGIIDNAYDYGYIFVSR